MLSLSQKISTHDISGKLEYLYIWIFIFNIYIRIIKYKWLLPFDPFEASFFFLSSHRLVPLVPDKAMFVVGSDRKSQSVAAHSASRLLQLTSHYISTRSPQISGLVRSCAPPQKHACSLSPAQAQIWQQMTSCLALCCCRLLKQGCEPWLSQAFYPC